jgi:uncharacterized protein (TIGR02145 family)
MQLNMNAAFNKKDNKKMFNIIKKVLVFNVMGVPVWITLNSDLYREYSVIVDAALDADWGFKSKHKLEVGGIYKKESNSFSSHYDYEPTNEVYPLNIQGEVNADARLEIYPRTESRFYGFFGPYAEIVPYVQGNYNATLQSQISGEGAETFLAWNSGINLGLDFRVGTQLKFLKISKSYGPIIVPCFYTTLWQSPVNLELLSELPEQAEGGNTISLNFKVTDLLNLPVPFCPVYIEGDGGFTRQLIFTNFNGEAQIEWSLPSLSGTGEFSATIYDAYKNTIKQVTHSLLLVTKPIVNTIDASDITETTAQLNGIILSDGGSEITQRGFYWSTNPSPNINDSNELVSGTNDSFSKILSELIPNTSYYYVAYATNSIGTNFGNVKELITDRLVLKPVVETNAATEITTNSVKLNGTVSSNGGAIITERGFYWSTSITNPGPETGGSKISVAGLTFSFNYVLSGLMEHTTHYFTAYASNSAGTSIGNSVSFETLQTIALPTVSTLSITNIAQNSASGGGNVTSDGGAAVTARGICWSTSPYPTTANEKTTDGSGTGSFSSALTGLTANTSYYVRAYATNNKGTAYGAQETFTTKAVDLTSGTFTDSRDGNPYKWVKIGEQVWMSENLAYLPEVSPSSVGSNSAKHYYVYGYNGTDTNAAKNTINYSTYGVLYNSSAAMAACPSGWHLPDDEEWKQLERTLGMSQSEADNIEWRGIDTGTILKATSGWGLNYNGTDDFGFSALPGGCRYNYGGFFNGGINGSWWSSTEDSTGFVWDRSLACSGSSVHRYYFPKEYGYSVRCVKD